MKFKPTSIPITVTGVANASAISAFSAIMVTLLIPEMGKPVLGFIVCEYFFPSISTNFS